ncbi:hypothetical protein ACFFHM_20400 [Halalkalibacter kiskunsagensis]|uniref:Uncharacterized protein n=1 Tax=Halalkalibacter kiskunsagensis TaxID=1548599 RepID=A0ABV6KHI2_9BACI
MSYYDLCCRYHGRVVTITDRQGRKHTGRIQQVTNSHVYLEPSRSRQFGGFGYGYYRGYGYRRGYPIAFAFITGIALGALLFW